VLAHALVHRPRLVWQIAAQQRVGEPEIGIDQFRLVPGLEGELDLFLAVPHAVGIEPQNLGHQRLRLRQVPPTLEPRRREIELLNTAFPLARLDQRLTEHPVPFGVVGVVGNPHFELLDRGLGRGTPDVTVGE